MIYNFHGNFSVLDQNKFKLAQEEDLIKICHYLQVDLKLLEKVRFEVFDTREGKQAADPNHSISRASARFNEMTLYRFWLPPEDEHFPHEITHLVAHTFAKPYILKTEVDTWDNKKIKLSTEMVSTSFMQEGLAIAVDDIVFGRKLTEEGVAKFIDDWCREQSDELPSLKECINLDGFGSFDNKIIVPFTASFSKFLLNKFGVERYKKMYVLLKETLSLEKNVKLIEKVYQTAETQLIKQWQKSLLLSN